jgi:hypothetical protein
MSKEDAVKAAVALLKEAGIDAKVTRIYGSTTEAIIVLPEVHFPPVAQIHQKTRHTALSVVLDQ